MDDETSQVSITNFNTPQLDPRDWFDLANDFNGILESGVADKSKDFQFQVAKTIDAFLCSMSRGIASTGQKLGSIVPSLFLIEKSLKDLGLESLGPAYNKKLRESYAYLGGMSDPPMPSSSN